MRALCKPRGRAFWVEGLQRAGIGHPLEPKSISFILVSACLWLLCSSWNIPNDAYLRLIYTLVMRPNPLTLLSMALSL